MSTFEKLKQFEPGREAKTVLLLLDVTEKVNRNGGSYCHLLLSDGEEQHTATMWDVKKETYAHFVNNLIECVINQTYTIILFVLSLQRLSLPQRSLK